MRKGWFKLDGVQDGDRSLEDQMKGLSHALRDVAKRPGLKVLDLGCAEGLISREFLAAGANVIGIEIVPDAAEVARTICYPYNTNPEMPRAHIETANLDEIIERLLDTAEDNQFDITLALAIIHKLQKPEVVVEYLIRATRDLCVVRTAEATPGYVQDWRTGHRRYEVKEEFLSSGFKLEREERGHYNEWMGYFRRYAA